MRAGPKQNVVDCSTRPFHLDAFLVQGTRKAFPTSVTSVLLRSQGDVVHLRALLGAAFLSRLSFVAFVAVGETTSSTSTWPRDALADCLLLLFPRRPTGSRALDAAALFLGKHGISKESRLAHLRQ